MFDDFHDTIYLTPLLKTREKAIYNIVFLTQNFEKFIFD